jgi:pSer/pThr/pTyr-binding forkhead associated (FHA) protein
MPITVIIRFAASEMCLTFDETQRVVIGRGASCDVRLPDASVSHRHAYLRRQGTDFVLVDEASTNGTFVGGVRVAPHTTRIVRSGDLIRIGRVWLELRVDQSPVTRDVAVATRDLALALVSKAMAAHGKDIQTTVRVVEGGDQGATLVLAEQGRRYVLGRGPQCDLSLSDSDASREHALVECRGKLVFVRDLGAKNGTWLGDVRGPEGQEVVWHPKQMMRIGRTVLALEEPVAAELAAIEDGPDEVLPAGGPVESGVNESSNAARVATSPEHETRVAARRSGGWSIADLVVMATAVSVLALSIAGLFWLLRS